MIKIYRRIENAEELVIGADPGEGVSWCAAVAISKKYKDTPLVFHARIESPQFGIELYKIGTYIKRYSGEFPLLAIERNTGVATIEKVRDLGYPMSYLYKQRRYDKVNPDDIDRIGFVTSSANRRKMLDELAMAVRKNQINVYDEQLIKEMLTFVIDQRTNEPRHEKGKFSDLIMATAIGWQMVEIITGGGKWVGQKRRQDAKFLPEKAEGFIVEHTRQGGDWRGSEPTLDSEENDLL